LSYTLYLSGFHCHSNTDGFIAQCEDTADNQQNTSSWKNHARDYLYPGSYIHWPSNNQCQSVVKEWFAPSPCFLAC